MNNDYDALVRDLDTLGIQKEVDLEFICVDSNMNDISVDSNEIPLSSTDINKEYSYCLKYNESNKNKITSAKIFYYTRYLGGFAVKIKMGFSNHKYFTLEFRKSKLEWGYEFEFCEYYKKVLKKRPIIFKSTIELESRMIMGDNNSVINEFFKIINEKQPIDNYRFF